MKKLKSSVEIRVYIYQLMTVILAVLLSLGCSLYLSLSEKHKSLDSSINNIAQAVSTNPDISDALVDGDLSPVLKVYLDSLIKKLHYVDIITICDMNSIRLYHATPDKIGKKFAGNDQYKILSGSKPYTTTGIGTLGRQRRAFYAVNDSAGKQVGFVMVAVLTESIRELRLRIILTFVLFAVFILAFSIFLSSHLYWSLRETLMGYRPEQFRQMYLERSEVINAMEEGILAVNNQGRILVMNKSAQSMLNLSEIPAENTQISALFPNGDFPSLPDVVSSQIPILEKGNPLGTVTIFRNRAELTRLAEELTGTRYMVDTLRAFNHEFMNKLHVILGYIEMGEPEKVSELILNTSLISAQAVSDIPKKIQVPAIAALLIGKTIRANELGISLSLKYDSHCIPSELNLPISVYSTILGNLIENSIEELNQNSCNVKEIEVGINIWKDGCILSVDDTGKGIPDEYREKIFIRGFSTKGDGRGTGMYLIKELVDNYHGILSIESEPGIGTSIIVTIPG